MKTLDDIIEFNKNNKDKALKYGQKILIKSKYFTTGRMVEEKYLKALLVKEEKTVMLNKVMDDNKLDVIIHMNQYNNLPAFTGFPSMTIPIGTYKNGMPVGMHMMARKFDDKTLIRAMYAIEQLLMARKAPQS